MSIFDSAQNFKCQINHSGDYSTVYLWQRSDLSENRGSVLIIHDINETIDDYTYTIETLNKQGFHVYSFNLMTGNCDLPAGQQVSEEPNLFPGTFRDLTVEVLQIIAYIKSIEKGESPYLLTQGLGSLIGLINSRKHPNFIKGFIACSPMFQLSEKIVPLRRLILKTLAEFFPNFILPKKLAPKFTRNRKITIDGTVTKSEAKVTAREAYEYLKSMSQARKNFAKVSIPTLLICPDQNAVHKYSFLKKAISKHKYEEQVTFINLHSKYHGIASDRASVLETMEKYVGPWLDKIESNHSKTQNDIAE